MATWILLFQLFFPTAPSAPATDAAESDGPRYRGIEAMFAKFELEADAPGA